MLHALMRKLSASMATTLTRCMAATVLALCMSSHAAAAQESDAPPSTPQPQPQPQPQQADQAQSKPAQSDKPASLDELLEIEEDQRDDSSAEAAERDHEEQLQQALDGRGAAKAFVEAVEKMALSADLLDTRFDTGLGTQRIQEDIIAKLELLIQQSRQQQSSSQRSSSSSQQQQPEQSRNQDPGQRQNQQNQQSSQRNNNPSESVEGDPPPQQEGDINTVLEESRSEWGGLPQRVRDMLLQGRREKYSNLYKQLTDEYYKRLAEEGSP